MTESVFELKTRASLDAFDVTDLVAEALADTSKGLALVSTPHTTVGLVLGPGDDAMLRDYIQLAKRWPSGHGPFEHFEENNPNSEAHLLSSFAGTSLSLYHSGKGLSLGKYQRIIFLEFDGPRTRKVFVRLLGGEA